MSRRLGRVGVDRVTMAHGGGGKAMHDFIDDLFVGRFDEGEPRPLEDQARIDLAELVARGDRLAFTTDSFVVSPLEFPGGDIGKLAICGTINDLAVGGALPLYLSCSIIVEEGVAIEQLRRIADSMAATAKAAGVRVVTGDTKVVERGACDRLFINTAGIGVIRSGSRLGVDRAEPGDVVLVSGMIGDHGAAIIHARGEMRLEAEIASDCAPLHRLIAALLDAVPETRFIRDATRGGVATVLVEIAEASRVDIEIRESATPIRPVVKGLCELLGLDPLYLANEGTIACVVPPARADAALGALRSQAEGRHAAVIGRVLEPGPRSGRVVLHTAFGGQRIVDMLVGDQLPRIC
jgi:hydrogenase expression/formation protein HypE